jgi:uncharacterized protein YjdB
MRFMRDIVCVSLICLLAGCDADSPMQLESKTCGLVGPTLAPSSATLAVGDTIRLSIGPMTNPCTGKGPFPAVFASSDETVAVVNAASGLVTARAVGKTTIIAASSGDPTWAAAAVLQVTK